MWPETYLSTESTACTLAKLLRTVGWVVLAVFVSSCGSTSPKLSDLPGTPQDTLPPKYTIVSIIHGDGDYLYHDTRGYEYRADEVALARVRAVATHNPRAEVFIFHQKPRSHFLLFFPRPDGEFSYYRNGHLVANESYWRNEGTHRFDPEAELARKYGNVSGADPDSPLVKFFLYFGHEIPEVDDPGYDASYPDRLFTVRDLAVGLNSFIQDRPPFDLLVLSTCYGGTPRTISSLAPYAETIVASPDNLHLSYLDLTPFERLEVGLGEGDVPAFAQSFARDAFERLAGSIQTTVTVAVYDVDRVGRYLVSVDSLYRRTLASRNRKSPSPPERCDCAEEAAFIKPGMEDGVAVFYRAPLFGRSKLIQTHSGWECIRNKRQ